VSTYQVGALHVGVFTRLHVREKGRSAARVWRHRARAGRPQARARGALTGKGLGGGVLSRQEADLVRI
jgi:hypothetical protein